ncbi:hypothetical protein ABI59_08900 [Acidobacteria bacterium Mor1]|nr:hypothetical protein ABI59_08900 [Acidobacteria bacterium Mor1]
MTRLVRIALLAGSLALLATAVSAGSLESTLLASPAMPPAFSSGAQDGHAERLGQSWTDPLDEPAGLDSSSRHVWRCPVTALECFYELDRACNRRHEGVVWSYFNYISGECVGQCSDGGEVQPNCPRSHIPRG